jgi:Acyl-CoA reductase (LuxC)
MNAVIAPLSDTGFRVPLIIRGRVIEDADLEFGGRRGGARFTTPDVGKHMDELVLKTPSNLNDLYVVPFTELIDYLCQLGGALNMRTNVHMQASYELARKTSGLTDELLANVYRGFTRLYAKDYLTLMMERTVGVKYLEGWIQESLPNGARVSIRAFGARAVHIIAGNNPGVSALTIARNVLTRSDAIIKTPSNDPLTAAAIARTMIEMAPDHPVTRHLSVAYWKGGDTKVERILYQPRNIEKIIAWGGLASVSHIIQYIQPALISSRSTRSSPPPSLAAKPLSTITQWRQWRSAWPMTWALAIRKAASMRASSISSPAPTPKAWSTPTDSASCCSRPFRSCPRMSAVRRRN